MRRIFLLLLWVLPFLILPISSQAISQTKLSDSSKYVQFKTIDDSRTYYVDMESITPISAPEGHRRINVILYVLSDRADYITAINMEYDYRLDRSLRQLISRHDVLRHQGDNKPLISVWRDKRDNIGITCRIINVKRYSLSGESLVEPYEKNDEYDDILERRFEGSQYSILNTMYKQAYGINFDDEMSSNLL